MKKEDLISFGKQIPANLFSGFVVSLIALPLGLGLSLAAGAPPIAGIITAIVGGFVVSILGGSHVTITGPGNGLVVVFLTAITALGDGDMYQGYLYTLAAIIISGAIIFALAFVNVGKLSDFFPSSSIQGMLAAIGIIILSKQFHVMLGNLDAQGSTIDLLIGIPNAIIGAFRNPDYHAPAIAGALSLIIMAYYAKIRNKYVQLLPAPMWIVVFSVGLAYYYEKVAGVPHPISAAYFIEIPDNIFGNIPRPNFGKIADINFIGAVFTLTLIATIESLLSIKAIDKLDPLRRRSNTNKDIRALGLATMLSGFVGGLNVVTVIARSSVNVNYNATNRSANFFHAAFVLVIVVLFKEQLQYIPYPALAAILVYTGYKLAAPAIIEKIFSIGKEQLLIFAVTLLVTLFTSLITGIVVGILTTFVVHMYLAKDLSLFFNKINHPNATLSIEEDGNNLIKVEKFSSFLNFFRLKKIIESIDPSEKVVVDLRQCKFVDHTVMENLWDYEQFFDKNNGDFQVIGLDLHNAGTDHPFAFRRALDLVPFVNKIENPLSRRQREVGEYMQVINWNYDTHSNYHMFFLRKFVYFKTRNVDHLYNVSSNPSQNIRLFDIMYFEGAFIAEEELHATMAYIQVKTPPPAFTLDKGDLYESLHYLGSFPEIKIKSYRDFSKRFTLRGNNLRKIRRFFTKDLVLFFESNPYYHIESNGVGGLLIMNKERHASVSEVKAMVDFTTRLEKKLNGSN